jgi:hypothetical protein
MKATPRRPNLRLSLSRSLKDVQILARDQTTAALAKRYAMLIDEAELLAAELDAIELTDESTAQTVARLAARIQVYTVVSDLGPKLLATLGALGMHPQARASKGEGGGVTGARTPAVDALARLRERRTKTK